MQDVLTKEQSDIASANHNLIYKYANDNGLNMEEYYGILAIGLCNAARIFDGSKGRFSAIAYRCMRNEVYMYWRKLNKKVNIPSDIIYSYDTLMFDNEKDEEKSFLDKLQTTYDKNDIINNVIFNMFVASLTEREKFIVDMLSNGLAHKEIADEIGCTRQNVSYHVKQIKKKMENIFV